MPWRLPCWLLAAPAASQLQTKDSTCFTPDFPLDYYDCCREQGPDGRTPLQEKCFNGGYSFERCCLFQFGPSIRGLPYRCAREEDGVAKLQLTAQEGLLRIACTRNAKTSAEALWLSSWLAAQFLLNLPAVVLQSEHTGWPLADIVQPLLHRPLRVLDVGCGAGFLSVALARSGHAVLAVDIDNEALAATRANARRNNVRVSTLPWDVGTSPSQVLLSRSFDVVFAELLCFAKEAIRDWREQPRRVALFLERVLANLVLLNTHAFIFEGVYTRAPGLGLEPVTAAIMPVLVRLGHAELLRRPCSTGNGSRCARLPRLSPRGWFSARVELGPPSPHGLIVW